MAVIDNREFIDELEKAGELIRVKQEVDWDCEAGAIVRRAEEMNAPAPLFENVRDYPGHRIFGAPFSNFRRAAIALGLDPDTDLKEIIDTYDKRMRNPIKPVVVKDAPCQENVIEGDEVDILMFPAPMVHEGDGGRYLSTWHFIATKDMDSDWTNWGMYRQMVHNNRTMGGLCIPSCDMGRMKAKYEAAGKPMPFATVIGPDPCSALVSTAVIPAGESEVDYAGALHQRPIELVKCKTVDLMVPAHAEIILEGEMLMGVEVEEGPFGEYTGYRSSPRMPRSVYRVKCITHRNDPITCMSNMGVPIDDCDICVSIGWTTEIKRLLEWQQFPITGVFVPPEGIAHIVVIGVKKPYNNIANQLGNLIFGSKFGGWIHEVVVCDDDVNIFDMKEVTHAIATKCHPVRGIKVQEGLPGHPLAPYLNLHERTWFNGSKVVFDCTWPLDWDKEVEVPIKSAFNYIYSQEVQDKVLKNWQNYGYK